MHIAINALSAKSGGGVTYLNELFKHLSEIDKKNEYTIVTTNKGEKMLQTDFKNFQVLSFKLPSFSPILRLLWEQICLWYILKKHKIDIIYSPANIGLILFPFPTVLMIQTVAPFSPEMIKKQNLFYKMKFKILRVLTVLSIQKAKKVIFITEKAKKELYMNFHLKEEDTNRIYHGKSNLFKPHLDRNLLRHIKHKYNLSEFILYVSDIYKYKNLFELVQAFSLIKDKINPHLKLVLIGKSFDVKYSKLVKEFILKMGIQEKVNFLGHVPHKELPFLYGLCKVFIYPSTCESFGLPLVEAMACGAPILSSCVEPMPEICQNAAFYFDPFDPKDIAEKLLTVLKDEDILRRLKQLSIKRANYFSWEKTAKETLNVIEQCK